MAAQTIVVLFNLRPGTARDRYEAWARTTDLPLVRGLESIGRFSVYRAVATMGGAASPYAYIEVIEVRNVARFGEELAGPLMQRVAAEFQAFADNPAFIIVEPLEPMVA